MGRPTTNAHRRASDVDATFDMALARALYEEAVKQR